MNTKHLDEIAETKVPDDFVVITREPGKVSAETRERVYRLFDITIDAFLETEGSEEE